MVAPKNSTAKSDFQEHHLPKEKKKIPKHMSNTFLPAISEEPSKSFMDEDVFDENEFLETENENEGLVTPTKTKPDEALSTPQAPKKKPAMKKSIANAQNASNSVDPVQVGLPSKFDVLCGQSRICANHTGNCRFQVVLDIYASRYEAAKSKQEKMMLTKEIVGCIATSGGRFLKYKDGLWNEISSVTARDKVSHALRTKVQTRKKQQTAKPSSSAKKKGSTRKGRHCRRRSAPASSAHTNDLSEVRAVSFDGSDGSSTSSNAIMDDLLRAQREIFEQLTKGDKQTNTPRKTNQHPLKRTETWS